MSHNISISISKDKFIETYLQTLNGFIGLNKPEFRIVKYVLENTIKLDKEAYKIIAAGIEGKEYTVKMQLKDLVRRKVLIDKGEELVINPVIWTGSNQVVINFNVI